MCFKYDPGLYCADLERNGYVHLKDVLSNDFVAHLADFYRRALADDAEEITSYRIAGKKRQFVFNFPSEDDALAFRAGMARLTGMNEEMITISERHLKVYDSAATPWPAPHKDRSASQISIGLPVFLSQGSSVCVFPEMDRTPNPNDEAVFLTERDRPDLASIYSNEKAVLLNEKIGDLVLFNGSSIFHERVKAAGTAVLYIKINDQLNDPLGENIYHSREVAYARL